MPLYYDIDRERLLHDLQVVRLRTPLHMSWLRALTTPIQDTLDTFNANREANEYTLAHNGQVIKLEAALNDVFDNEERRIYIDTTLPDGVWLYTAVEHRPLWLGTAAEAGAVEYGCPVWLFTDAEIAAAPDFIVYVPSVVYDALPSEVRMRALIDKYRLPSKFNYTIQSF